MKTQSFRFVLCSIIVSVTWLKLAAASPASSGNGTHFCGFSGQQPDNRRYARTLANLDVDEARMVRLIYFLPSDQPYHADVVQRMKDQILNIQSFYAEQMEAHGYEKATFRVETGAQAKPMVHRVDGQYPENYYSKDLAPMFEECERAFNLKLYISLIVEETSSGHLGGGQTGLGERWGKNSGYAVVTGEVEFGVTAHELGHAFGLEHDFRDGAYIMSYGPGWNRLSACTADFLTVDMRWLLAKLNLESRRMNWGMPSDWSTIFAMERTSCRMAPDGIGYLLAPPIFYPCILTSIPISQLNGGSRRLSN